MAEGRSYTTGFGAYTKGFEDGIDRMNKALKEHQNKLKENKKEQTNVSRKIKAYEKELKALEAEIKKNGEATEKQKEHQKELNDIISKAKQRLDDLKIAQAALKKEIEDTKNKIEEQKKAFDTYKTSVDQVKNSAKEMGKDIVTASAAAAAGMMVLDKVIFSTGKEFTAAMSEVGAISGASAEQLEQLEQTAREYGARTQFSATEAAQALKYMALAGWDVNTSMTALPGILNLAAASGMDLAKASDMVTDYLSAFGMEADKAAYMADLMTYAQSNSNTSAEQLGQAWGNCAANLSAAGQDVETVTAMLEGLANNGIKGARAGTSLTAIMRDISNAMENGTISIGAANIAVQDSAGNFRDLTDIMADLSKATDGLGTAEKTAALSSVFTADSIKGVNTILKAGVDNIADYENALRNSTGAASEAAKKMNDNLTGDIKNLNSAFDEFKLKLFEDAESPMRDLVQTLTNDGIPALEQIAKHLNIIIPLFLSAASAVGAYKAAINILSIVKGISQATAALTVAKEAEKAATDKATASQTALNTVQAANPIGLVVAALGALVTGLTSYAVIAQNTVEKTEKLNKTMEKASEVSASVIASSESETKYIEELGEEYEKLRTKAELTTAEKEKLAYIAETLQNKLGLEAGEVKNAAGEYQELTDKINDAVKAMKQEAQVSAAKSALQAAYEEQLKAEEQYQLKLKEVREKYPTLYDEKGQLNRNEYTYETQEAVKEVQELKQAYKNAAESVDFYNEKIKAAVSATEDEGNAQDELKKKTSSAGAAFESAKDAVDEYASHLFNGDDGYNIEGFYDLFSSVGDAAEELQNRLTEANRKLEENRSSIRQTKDEILQLEKDLKNPELNDVESEKKSQQLIDARQKLSELKTEQVALKKAVTDAEKAYKAAAWSAKTLNDRLAEIGKTSASIRGEMNSLSNTFKELQEGNQLSLDTLLSLSEKYPDYAAQILSATDNLNAQKDVVKLLYEAKKAELILNLEAARDEIKLENDKIELQKKSLQKTLEIAQAEYNRGNATAATARIIENLKNQIEELNDEFDSGESKVDAYNNAIAKILTLGMPVNNNNNTNNNYTPAQTAASQSTQWEWEWLGEKGIGSTSSQARTQLVERVYNLGLITQQELKAEYEKILREEANTYEESYDLRLKLKNVTDRILAEEVKAKEEAEKKKEEAEKARLQSLKRQQELASAAYRKLVEGEISAIQDKNKAIQDGADAQIKAIDDEMEKRRQQKEDDSRQKELDAVNLQLKYFRGDDMGRASLEQRRQEILNEQAEAAFERQMEQKKLDIQTQANSKIDSNTAAIDKLTAVMEDVAYRLASSHSAQEVVSRITDRTELIEMFKDARYMTDGQIQSFIQALKQEIFSG